MKIVGVDVGGTFTDVYVSDSIFGAKTGKALSTSDVIGGILEAMRGTVDVSDIDAIALGSTIATNALVQRKLARVGLIATAGFRDILDIRRLWRPQLFGYSWERPEALVTRDLRLEARGRIGPEGDELLPLELSDVVEACRRFRHAQVEAVAISFLFSYRNPGHERAAAEVVRGELPEIPVFLSSEIDPQQYEYERTSTTVIAAGLGPVVESFLEAAEQRLAAEGLNAPLRLMKSNGGVMSPAAARRKPVELVKSGPAGGASAGSYLSETLDLPDLVLLDIGGTTADATLVVDGTPARTDVETVEWDIPIRVPVVDIRSIGAGGGSIAVLDAAGGLRVGPGSAGVDPGPVAYGRGGTEPTVTDAAVTAGWIDPGYFLGGQMRLDAPAAEQALGAVAEGLKISRISAAAAILHLATTEMAALIRQITIERGLDPRRFTLVAFGGAGPLFLGPLMEEMEMGLGLVPVGASTLSAMGGAFADITYDYVRSEITELAKLSPLRLGRAWEELLEQARRDIELEGVDEARFITTAGLRYSGQWHEIEIPLDLAEAPDDAAKRFEVEHERLWGHRRAEDPIELVTLRVRAVSSTRTPAPRRWSSRGSAHAKGTRELHFYDQQRARDVAHEASVYERSSLPAGWRERGPIVVEEVDTNTIIPPGFEVFVGNLGHLEVRR